MNRLSKERSPYLLKSAHQPVDWYPWSQEAFEKAKKEDKPILLSIGGVWCHWCHVMAHESFENEEIAKIINENFVAIKVDRDERPDVDRRYQEVVVAITGSGGWPLTVFLTPDGKPFFGGTYFPPEDRWGRIGFKNLLLKIAKLWKEDRDKIIKSAESIWQMLESHSLSNYKDTISEEVLTKIISSLLSSLDYQKGGIAGAPKFHHASAIELLLIHYYFTKREFLKEVIQTWLDGMAKGGVYDHLLGGFFRYSTDEDWLVPHFEKMLFDNAELLKLYSIAYKLFSKELYAYIAQGIVNYYKEQGTDERGGFYASQDADIGKLNEGGYYTFTYGELKEILNEEELEIAKLYFGVRPEGHMHHGKNVLHLNMEEGQIAEVLGKDEEYVKAKVAQIREKLRTYREKREIPFIDRSIYVNWNGLMISGFCEYYKVFNDEWALEFARKTVDRILEEFYIDDTLYHTQGVEGFSEDYVFFAKALLDMYEIVQDQRYLSFAVKLTDQAIERFWDNVRWGFLDRRPQQMGALSIENRPIQDTPTQSVNGTAPYLLLLVYTLTGEDRYLDFSAKTLEAFSRFVRDFPMVSFSYGISLYAFLRGIYKVETRDYFDELLKAYRPFKFVLSSHVEGVVVCEGQSCKIFNNLKELML